MEESKEKKQDIMENEKFPKVICQECKKEYYRITNTHLWKYHQMTVEEYREKYPDSLIESVELAQSYSQNVRGKTYEEIYGEDRAKALKEVRTEAAVEQMKDNEQRDIRREARTGFQRTQEEIDKMLITRKEHYHITIGTDYRKIAFETYDHVCAKCGSEENLEVHHKDGNNFPSELGNHSPENLLILCKKCHSKVHAELKRTLGKNIGLSDVEKGVHYILLGLKREFGLDITDVNFKDTPKRVARAYYEIFEGINSTHEIEEILSTSFPSTYNGMVVAKGIRCFSMCPHHLLPVEYYIDFGYIADKTALGISKLSRFIELLAKQPILQETFTHNIMQIFKDHVNPKGTIVQVKGRHMCMAMRGVKQPDSWTYTSEIDGLFEESAVREEFRLLLNSAN